MNIVFADDLIEIARGLIDNEVLKRFSFFRKFGFKMTKEQQILLENLLSQNYRLTYIDFGESGVCLALFQIFYSSFNFGQLDRQPGGHQLRIFVFEIILCKKLLDLKG